MNEALEALKALDVNPDNWDPLIIHLLTKKLHSETLVHWEENLSRRNELSALPTIKEFQEFMESRFRTLEAIASSKPSHRDNKPSNVVKAMNTFKWNSNLARTSPINYACPICAKDHRIKDCQTFTAWTVTERSKYIKSKSRCLNCLAANHPTSKCNHPLNCRTCGKRHNTLLHFDSDPKKGKSYHKPNKEVSQTKTQVQANNLPYPYTQNHFTRNVASEGNTFPSNEQVQQPNSKGQEQFEGTIALTSLVKTVLLATAIIKIQTPKNGIQLLRALLDQGSQASFITEDAIQRLNLPRKKTYAVVSGLGASETSKSQTLIECVIQPHFTSDYKLQVQAYVLKKITGNLPHYRLPNKQWTHLEDIKLADPNYMDPGKIDMLLGAEVYSNIILSGILKGNQGTPIAQNTSLGWVLSGEVNSNQINVKTISLYGEINTDSLLKKFWEIEDIPCKKQMTELELKCEENFAKTHRRALDGKFIVKLPFKNDIPNIGESRNRAVQRLMQMEKKFISNETLRIEYKKFMDEYLALGHMEQIPWRESKEKLKETCYFPHHAVIKEESTTTKLRVVFDGSCKTTNQTSLNDNLLIGPTLQDDLSTIILRWRNHRIVLTGDIEKMYRQIWVSKDQTDYQRILWRDSTDQPIKEYRLLTVTYGTSCAPYLAIKSLRQLAEYEQVNFPRAAKIVLNDFYVDDMMTGCDGNMEATNLYSEIQTMLKRGGFRLRKWASNSEEVLKTIPEEERAMRDTHELSINDTIKTLGIRWNPKTDTFSFLVKLSELKRDPTKRTILSEVSQIFDPLGWLAPTVVIGKIMYQNLWLAGLGWDEPLPIKILDEYKKFREHLPELNEITIPRWNHFEQSNQIQLHGFSDASLKAYAAVVYSRCIARDGKIFITLLASKTKVAPIKQISLPRLELCGAVLLTKLLKTVKESMKLEPVMHAWTDSTIVISWLRSHPSRWKTFVGNRVAEIQAFLNVNQWHHVRTKDNPADCASRGLTPTELKQNQLWWHGPKWLSNSPENWPKQTLDIIDTVEEKKISLALPKVETSEILLAYSDLHKLIRIVAYCQRFVHNCKTDKQNRQIGILTLKELKKSELTMIKLAQRLDFSAEYQQLQEKKGVSKDSRIINLNPWIDSEGVLRVGGRLQFAHIPYQQKYPAILSDKSHLTNLIIKEAHKSTLHGGVQLMLNVIRKKFWILNGRNTIRQQIHKCMKCFRYRATSREQLMGNLPEVRVKPCRPFLHTGIDFTGAITIRESKCRGRVKTSKGYLSVFICLVTRAIHIEVVSDMTSEAFIAAFRRFTSRRGLCSDVYTDCGTNFVGANNKLREISYKQLQQIPDNLVSKLASQGVQWHFIPPASPHFGGIWEAGVKSTKYHLKRVIGTQQLTFEELATLASQIEACLNSRPLYPLTSDPEDCSALTPGHFLIGDALLTPPEPSNLERVSLLKHWQLIQRMYVDFWRRWVSEYLIRLQQRPKWVSLKPNIQKGELVIVKDERIPPSQWILGRVIDTHQGKDDLVRVVTIKCKEGLLKRPITKICPLPIENEVQIPSDS